MAKNSQLDTLLRIRRLEEDMAKAGLAAANLAERQAHELLEVRRAAYRSHEQQASEASDPSAFLRARMSGSALGAGVIQAEKGCQEAQSETEAARGTMRTARMRTQGLERLVDRAAQARFQEMLAADQRTAEESRAGKLRRSRS